MRQYYEPDEDYYDDDIADSEQFLDEEEDLDDEDITYYNPQNPAGIYSQYQGSQMAQRGFGAGGFGADYDDDDDADPYAQIGSFGNADMGARGMSGGLGSRGGLGGIGRGSAGGLGGGGLSGGGMSNPMITGGSSGLFGSAISKNPLFTGKHGGQKSTLTFGQSGGPNKFGLGGSALGGLGMQRPQTTGGLSGDNAYDFDIDLSKAKRPTTVKREPAHKTATQKASALKKPDTKKNDKRVTIGSATVHEISRDYDEDEDSQPSEKKEIDYKDTGFKKKEQTELERVRDDMKKSISQIQQLKKTEELAESEEIDASPPSKFGGGIGSGDSSYGNDEFQEESFNDKKEEEEEDQEMERMRKYMQQQMIKPNDITPVQKVSAESVVSKEPEKPSEAEMSSNIDQQFEDSQSFDERMATALPSKQHESVSLLKKSPSPIIQQAQTKPLTTDSLGVSKTPTPPPAAPTIPIITKPVFEQKPVTFSMEPEMIKSGVEKVVYRKEYVNTNDKNFQTEPDLLSGPVPSNREYLLEACLRDEKRAVKRLEEEVRRANDKNALLEDTSLKRELQLNSAQQDSAYSREKLKMLQDEVANANQHVNAYKVELADYIKRIDIVLAQKEDLKRQVERAQEETERRLRLQEERVKLQMDRTESRAISDLRHQYEIRLEERTNDLRGKQQEIDYLQQKSIRLEAENKALRVSKKPNEEAQKQIDELKKEIYVLQVQSKQAKETTGVVSASAKELEDLENLVKGYQKENQRQLEEIKKLKREKKATEDLMYKEAKRIRQEQARLAKEHGSMLVVNSESTALATLNQMGRGGIIRDSDIDVLKERVERLEQEVKEKQEIIEKREKEVARARGDIGREGLLKELEGKERQIEQIQREKEDEAERLNRKIEWYQESENLLKEKDAVIASKNEEIKKLNVVVRKAKGVQNEREKLQRLEKKDKELDTEARFRDQEIKLRAVETEKIDLVLENEQLKAQVKSLEVESIAGPPKQSQEGKKFKSLELQLKKANQRIEELEKSKRSKQTTSALKVENEKLKKKVADLVAQKQKQVVSAPHLKEFLKSEAGNALLKAYHDTVSLKTGIRKRDPREAMYKIDTIFSELQEATSQSQFQKENEDALGVLLSAFQKITQSVHAKGWKEAEKSTLRAENLLLNLLSSNGENAGEETKKRKQPRSTAQVIGDGEEQFWSDFEDDDFQVDQEEDKLAQEALYDLQKWAPGNQENIVQALGGAKLVKLGKLKNALEMAGFETHPPTALSAFLRRLDLAPKTGRVVVADLLHNIKTKPPTWWGERLRNNSFQARNRVSKMGNCGPIIQSEGVLDFLTQQVLPQKIRAHCSLLVNKVLPSLFPQKKVTDYLNEDIQEIESEQPSISKQQFREAMVIHRAPFTRQEMHLISKLVQKDTSGSLSSTKLQSFFTNPHSFLKAKFSSEDQAPYHSGVQPLQSPRNQDELSKELMARIVEHLGKQPRGFDQLRQHFIAFDEEHNEQLGLNAFQKSISEAQLPLSRIEASQLFLENAKEGSLNWLTFLEKLRAAKEGGFLELENKDPNSSTRDLKFKLVQAQEMIKVLQKQLADKVQTPTFQPDYSAQQTLRVRLSQKEGLLGTLNSRLQQIMSENERLKSEKNILSSDLQECAKDMVEPSRQEFNVLMRKIQILQRRHQERESETRRRAKQQQELAQQRLDEMQRVLNKERNEHRSVVDEKNREIASFRMQLQGILQEMQALKEYQLKKRQMRAVRNY